MTSRNIKATGLLVGVLFSMSWAQSKADSFDIFYINSNDGEANVRDSGLAYMDKLYNGSLIIGDNTANNWREIYSYIKSPSPKVPSQTHLIHSSVLNCNASNWCLISSSDEEANARSSKDFNSEVVHVYEKGDIIRVIDKDSWKKVVYYIPKKEVQTWDKKAYVYKTLLSDSNPKKDKFFCPGEFYYDESLKMCVTESTALGPFPKAMIEKCESYGGGKSCTSSEWSLNFAQSIRGDKACPLGTIYNADRHICADKEEAFGPFTFGEVENCLLKEGGKVCYTNRWHISFLDKVTSTIPYMDIKWLSQYDNTLYDYASCNVTAASMAMSKFGVNISPDTLTRVYAYGNKPSQYATPYWFKSMFESELGYGWGTQSGSLSQLKSLIDQGIPVLLQGFFTYGGHIVTVVGYDDTGLYINDSNGMWKGYIGGYDTWANAKAAHYSYDSLWRYGSTAEGWRPPMGDVDGNLWLSAGSTQPFNP